MLKNLKNLKTLTLLLLISLSSPSLSLAETPTRFESPDGTISVTRPDGDDWECLEQNGQQGDTRVSLLKCRSVDPDQFFFMLAKVYNVAPEQIMTPKALIDGVYMRNYEKIFQDIKVIREAPKDLGPYTGHELELTATSPRGEIKKREWVLHHDDKYAVISAEGHPSLFLKFSPQIDAWMTQPVFSDFPVVAPEKTE